MSSGSEVMLQGFHWTSHTQNWWSVIQGQASSIAQAGFDRVWLPPSSASAASEGYLPNVLYDQSGAYGDETALRAAIRALNSAGVEAIADIVINHRVGTTGWGDFTDPTWGCWAVVSNDEWEPACGNSDSGDGYGPARDLDHSNSTVRSDLTTWMNWLKNDIGYDGWRFDYVKGFWGGYVGEYIRNTSPSFAVGELWDNLNLNDVNPHRQQIVDWIDSTEGRASAFDFTTKGILQQAVAYGEYWRLRDSNGAPSGVLGWWPDRAVTFIDNHDTGPSPGGGQSHWPFPSNEVMQGYAYILTHPGTPTVYWPHYFEWGLGAEIRELIQIRKSSGLTMSSSVDIVQADGSVYAAVIDDKVAMKIGPGSWSPGSGWALATSGTNYAVWTR